MITAGVTKDHVPFGRITYDLHPSSLSTDNSSSKSLSEAVGNISIYDSQHNESWSQRVCPTTGVIEELYFKDKTVVLSATSGCQNGAGKLVKTYTVQSKIQMAFWCSFLLPSNELDRETGAPLDEVQTGFCVVESNMVTVVIDDGTDYHVPLPFHISAAWPLERGILFQRAPMEKTPHHHRGHHTSNSSNNTSGTATHHAQQPLPIWFSMLHPLADLSPVICKTGSELSYVTDTTHQLVYISSSSDPYLAVVYNSSTKTHYMYLTRRTTPQEEKTYTELAALTSLANLSHGVAGSRLSSMAAAGAATSISHNMTPGRSGVASAFLTLSSVLSPTTQNMSPRVSALGYSSLRSTSYTASPSLTNRLNPTLSVNTPSLSAALNPLNPSHRSATASPSVSASVARSSFVSTGQHHSINQAMDSNLQTAEAFEPIRPDICLQHVWTDNQSFAGKASRVFIYTDMCNQKHLCMLIPAAALLRCIKLGQSQSTHESVVFGSSINIPAKDACPSSALNMMLVLDLESNVHFYCGQTQISMLYIPRLSFGANTSLSATPVAPGKSAVLASSRPGSATRDVTKCNSLPSILFDTSQDESTWSPVQMDLNDSNNLFIQKATATVSRVVSSLHSVTRSKVAMMLANGDTCSLELPSLCENPVSLMCVQALCLHLPYNVAIQILPKWYLHNHQPGQSDSNRDELENFFLFVLDACGIPKQLFAELYQNRRPPTSPCISTKRARTIHEPSDDDFYYLLHNTDLSVYSSVLGMSIEDSSGDMEDDPPHEKAPPLHKHLSLDDELESKACHLDACDGDSDFVSTDTLVVDMKCSLAAHTYSVFFLLYICYEELKLNIVYHKDLSRLARFLCSLSSMLKLTDYRQSFLSDFPQLNEELSTPANVIVTHKITPPEWFPHKPLILHRILMMLLLGEDLPTPVYYLPFVTNRLRTVVTVYALYGQQVTRYSDLKQHFILPVPVRGKKASTEEDDLLSKSLIDFQTNEELILHYIYRQDFTQAVFDSLPFAVMLVIHEVLYKCQASAKPDWCSGLLSLIKRQDLAQLKGKEMNLAPMKRRAKSTAYQQQDSTSNTPLIVHQPNEKQQQQRSGLECVDHQIFAMRWSKDLRIEEIKRCLNSSQPVRITLQQKPEVSDHHFIEEKQKHLLALCQRTMALPAGRGMLTLRSHHPVLTESLHIPVLCLSGRSYPTQSSVELSNDAQASKLSVWPSFHNGVAAGLCIDRNVEVDTSWILYNKPKVNDKDEQNVISEHAGFLMALGLNGHLGNLARLSLHDYLIKGHEMTAVGILLGISATMRATMDIDTIRLLTIHIPSLLPPSTTQLDLSHSTKIAAIVGLGLVYQGSGHRHIISVLLQEIDHPPDVSKGQTTDRESYSLSAGIALGMVMMGRGTNLTGLSGLNIANRLSLLMSGGHRTADMLQGGVRSGNGQVYEGEEINTDVTSAGATIALGLAYFDTNNESVCDWVSIPQSQYLLEGIRPDFLQLRVIARSLIMWSSVVATEEWIASFLPCMVAEHAFKRPKDWQAAKIDYETMSQAYCYVISGSCFALALKFAGTADGDAYHILLKYVKQFVEYSLKPSLADQPGKSIIENTICVCLISLSMVMAGSGDLEVLRLCRFLRTRILVPTVNYGSQMAIHLALGLLCIGSGKYTLSNSTENLPLLICAFFPKFPIHSNDNRYHLQALRHIYALAAEPKLLVPFDVDTDEPTYLPIEIKMKNSDRTDLISYKRHLPAILPSIDSIEEICIMDPQFWPIYFKGHDNLMLLRQVLYNGSGRLPVKRRSGLHPKDLEALQVIDDHSDTARSNASKSEVTGTVFTNDRKVTPYHQLFISGREISHHTFLHMSWKDCVVNERPELLATYSSMYQALDSPSAISGLPLQQFLLLQGYTNLSRSCVLSKELVEFATHKLDFLSLIDSTVPLSSSQLTTCLADATNLLLNQ